ncbi:LamB/YcsF family protein [Paenibacillus glycanilyticus]|uniref:5-oxoprolinase subunit PxpA n=1 Tax=Paenibacillus glycanilyticus TaxID=126569 RepID=UPI00203F3D8A|nr:5-oxoprolinase subunit PxpA [Paenibacillus glycanilyticus]MCM3631120.1 LamB/YcsF family protein [Paenibacillus glycanilyticus]
MRKVDLNCDMGESFGIYQYGADQEMMPLITSANIACGFHGGDASVMRESVALAKAYGIRVGAHIGLPDRGGFGRRYMDMSPNEVYAITLYQLGALEAFLRAEERKMSHVKLHGALYMMAAEDKKLSDAFAQAVHAFQPSLRVYTLPDSETAASASRLGLPVVNEYFADRPYLSGKVKMFGWTLGEIGSPAAIAARVEAMLGDPAFADIGTVCVHSDTAGAPAIMSAIRDRMEQYA